LWGFIQPPREPQHWDPTKVILLSSQERRQSTHCSWGVEKRGMFKPKE
jgi:hypothetical protein